MIKKIFIQVLIVSLLVCFLGFNYDTKVNIRFWFSDKLTLNNVSLFIALASSYLLGLLTFIPFYIFSGIKKKNKEKVSEVHE